MVQGYSLKATINNNTEKSDTHWNDFNPTKTLKVMRVVGEEKRKKLHNITTHRLALLIIGSFLIILTFKIFFVPDTEIPPYFISIVSTVIGFYFAHTYYN